MIEGFNYSIVAAIASFFAAIFVLWFMQAVTLHAGFGSWRAFCHLVYRGSLAALSVGLIWNVTMPILHPSVQPWPGHVVVDVALCITSGAALILRQYFHERALGGGTNSVGGRHANS